LTAQLHDVPSLDHVTWKSVSVVPLDGLIDAAHVGVPVHAPPPALIEPAQSGLVPVHTFPSASQTTPSAIQRSGHADASVHQSGLSHGPRAGRHKVPGTQPVTALSSRSVPTSPPSTQPVDADAMARATAARSRPRILRV
jgi:hypothetical protein